MKKIQDLDSNKILDRDLCSVTYYYFTSLSFYFLTYKIGLAVNTYFEAYVDQ